jgi:exonuclease III
MSKGKSFQYGQAYVAFSRVRSIEGLKIVDFQPTGIKASPKVSDHIEFMRSRPLVVEQSENNFKSDEILNKLPELQSSTMSEILSTTSVMCFTETYLTASSNIDSFLQKHDYIAFRQDVPIYEDPRTKHGIMICAQRSLKPVAFGAYSLTTINVQCQAVLIEKNMTKMIVCAIYRPQSQPVKIFVELMKHLLDDFRSVNLPTIICGDFNDDLLEKEHSSHIVEVMSKYGYSQYIKQATSVRGTLIDHMYLNRSYKATKAYVTEIYFSDHAATFLKCKI